LSAASRADDAIKAGKWEFSAQIQVPGMPQLPPGVTLPPGVSAGPNGMNVTRTSCVTSDRPMPADMHQPGGQQQPNQCKITTLDRSGGTARWAMDCPQRNGGTVHTEGTAHYSGDTMEADSTTRVEVTGRPPQTTTQHVTGHYLGPCDDK
jgi:hypothetical protein